MSAIFIILFASTIILFSYLALSVYKPTQNALRKCILFVLFFTIQIAPISFFYTFDGNPEIRQNFTESKYEKCMTTFGKERLCRSFAASDASKEFDHPYFGLLFIFSIFILTPTSGASLQFAESAIEQKSSKKALFSALAIIALLSVGFFIIWGFCLPPTHVPSQIKTASLVVGLPLLTTLFVFSEAFGKALAHSGIHAPRNILNEFVKKKREQKA